MSVAPLRQFRPQSIPDGSDSAAVIRGANLRFQQVAQAIPSSTPMQVINLLDYGWVANKDVTAAMTTAMRDAADVGVCVVQMPPSVGYLSAGILYPSYVQLLGYGWSTVLRHDPGVTVPFTMLAPVSTGVTSFALDRFTLDHQGTVFGNNTKTPCVSINGTVAGSSERVQFYDSQTMGLWCDATTSHPTVGFSLRHPWFNKSAGGGNSLFGAVQDFESIGGKYNDCKDDAFAIQDSTNGQPVGGSHLGGRFLNNNRRLNGQAPHAIALQGCKEWALIAPTIDSTCAEGILVVKGLVACENVTTLGAIIRNAGITPDSTVNVPGSGITYRQVTGGTIDGCDVTLSRQSGINLEDSTDVALGSANRTYLNGEAGVYLRAVNANCTGISIGAMRSTNNGTSGTKAYGIGFDSLDGTHKVDDVTMVGFRASGQTDAVHFLDTNTGSVKDIGGQYDGNTNEVGGSVIPGYTRVGVTGATKTFIVAKSANYVATGVEGVVTMDATAGARSVTLPSAASCLGVPLTVKKSDASGNAVTVVGTVDGAVNPTLAAQYNSMTVVSDGTNWNKIASV